VRKNRERELESKHIIFSFADWMPYLQKLETKSNIDEYGNIILPIYVLVRVAGLKKG